METQAGVSSACSQFATAVAGDMCIDFAKAHGIEPAQLYEWNPVLGSGGADCSKMFWAEESYCVGVSASSMSDSPGLPQPPQSSILSVESSASTAMYTATAPGNTAASPMLSSSVAYTAITPGDIAAAVAPSSSSQTASIFTKDSLPASSEDVCYSTVTSSITQTVTETETVYATSSTGSVAP